MIQSPKRIIKIKPERLFVYVKSNIILSVNSYNLLQYCELFGCKDRIALIGPVGCRTVKPDDRQTMVAHSTPFRSTDLILTQRSTFWVYNVVKVIRASALLSDSFYEST
jgi:hypothetical protein